MTKIFNEYLFLKFSKLVISSIYEIEYQFSIEFGFSKNFTSRTVSKRISLRTIFEEFLRAWRKIVRTRFGEKEFFGIFYFFQNIGHSIFFKSLSGVAIKFFCTLSKFCGKFYAEIIIKNIPNLDRLMIFAIFRTHWRHRDRRIS